MSINKIILLDWDDTIFPTSWVIENNIKITNNTIEMLYPYFNKLDMELFNLLNNLKNKSKIIIVTNAMVRWVHMSSRVLKKCHKFILNNINIISARDLYQNDYPNDVYKWKENVFNKEITKFINNRNKTHSLISIGDADYEYQALVNMHYTRNIRNKIDYFKTIKFKSKPDLEIVIDQINVLNKCGNNILNLNKHLDLQFYNK